MPSIANLSAGLALCLALGLALGLSFSQAQAESSSKAEEIPWLKDVAATPLPITLTAKQRKTSRYLLEPLTDRVTIAIAHDKIHWRTAADPAGFILTKYGIKGAEGYRRLPWLSRLFAALKAVGEGQLGELREDFALTSEERGKITAVPRAKDMAAAIKSLNLKFKAAAKGAGAKDDDKSLVLRAITIKAPNETTELSGIALKPAATTKAATKAKGDRD